MYKSSLMAMPHKTMKTKETRIVKTMMQKQRKNWMLYSFWRRRHKMCKHAGVDTKCKLL